LSTIGDIIRHRRLSLFGHVARLDPGVPAHDALRLMVAIYEGKSQWPAGEDHWVALTTSGSTMARRMPMLYRCLRNVRLHERVTLSFESVRVFEWCRI